MNATFRFAVVALLSAMTIPNVCWATTTLIEAEDTAHVTYAGTWQTRTQDTDDTNANEFVPFSTFPQVHSGKVQRSETANSTASFTFTGQSVSVIFLTSMLGGQVTATIDGTSYGTINLFNNAYQSPPSWQMYFGACYKEIIIANNLSAGSHTLVLTVSGTKPYNWSVCGTRVDIDAFRYSDAPMASLTGQVIDQDGDAVTRNAEWQVTSLGNAEIDLTGGPQDYTIYISDDGTYSMSGILPGTYTVTAKGPGMKSAAQTGVQVTAGQTTTVNFQIGIGTGNALWEKIHAPRGGTPVLRLPGGSFDTIVNAPSNATGWSGNLHTQYNTYPLTITGSTYDEVKGWTVTATIPASIPFELYDLQLNWQDGSAETNTSVRAVKVYNQFKTQYYFIHSTDPQNGWLDYQTVVGEINIINPEFVITTGDNISGPWRPGPTEWDVNQWNSFMPIFNSHRVPTFSAPGNHCIGPGVTIMQRYYKQLIGRRYWAQRYGKHLVMTLDNTIFNQDNAYKFDQGGYYDAREKWMIAQLQANPDATMKFLGIHVGLDSFTDLTSNSWYQTMAAYGANGNWLDQYHVSMVVHGHWGSDTVYFMANNAPYVQTRDMEGAKGYRLIRINNDSIGSYTYNGSGTASLTAGNLWINYAKTNNGTSNTNTATIVNNNYEHFEQGLIKFIMPRGRYSVNAYSGTPTITQTVDSDNGQYSFVYVNYDIPANTTSTVNIYPNGAMPAGCYVFYNNSAYDGNNTAANAADDAAIATDKTPLRPGQTATLANYTSYDKGINGIMVDLPTATSVTASDFTFKVGNSNTPSSWSSVSNPAINVRLGAGTGGSNRVTLTWAAGKIKGKWLQLTVKATTNTGIVLDTVYYFGNALGETGNSSASARVDSADVTAIRNDTHKTFANPAPITDMCDVNRDRKANTADETISRSNFTTVTNQLNLITVP